MNNLKMKTIMKTINTIKNFAKRFVMILAVAMTTVNVWAGWVKATSIEAGDVVVLVCEDVSKELSGISTTSTKYGLGTEYETTPAGTMAFTVGDGNSDGTFSFKNGNNYLNWGSGNSLSVNSTLSANTSWNVEFDGDNVTIENASAEGRILMWNNSSPRFACYSGQEWGNTYKHVQLYKETCSDVVTVATNGTCSHASIKSVSTSSLETCSSTDANREVTITITPATGYTAVSSDRLTITGTSATYVSGPTANGSDYRFVYRYAKNASGTSTIGVSLSTLKTYTVSVVSNNGGYGSVSPTSVTNVPHGTVPTSNGNKLTVNGTTITATPTSSDDDWAYTFSSWSNVPASVTGACTITANFSRSARTYTNYRTECPAPCDPMTAPSVTVTPTYNGASLSWGAVSHATKYKVYIFNNDDSDVESNENVSTTSYTVSAALSPSTTYKYRVEAISEDEALYCSSNAANSFTTSTAPSVTLYYSENGVLSAGVSKQILTNFELAEPTSDPCEKKFVGWSKVTVDETDEAPSMMQPGATYQIPTNENCTIYAVYATVNPGVSTYTLTPAASLSEGTYVIAAYDENYKLLTGGVSSGKLVNETEGSSIDEYGKIVSLPEDACEFTFTAVAGGFSIQKPNDDYLGYTSSSTNNNLAFGESYSDLVWNATAHSKDGYPDNGLYLSTSAYKVSANASSGSNTFVRGYSSSTYNPIYLFKKSIGASSTNAYSTTCQGKVAKPVISGVTASTTYEEEAPTVSITCGTTGATIYYTTDNSDPLTSETKKTYSTAFSLNVNGTYHIRAIAIKQDMVNSDEATKISNVTIDLPYTTIASFIAGHPATAKKLVFTESSNAVVLGSTDSRIYIQDPTGGIYLYVSSGHGKSWAKEKKVVGTLTGSYELNNNTPRMNVTDFGETVATADGNMPGAVVIEGAIDADKFAANRNKLVTVSGLSFQSQSVADGGTINITRGDDTYAIYNAFNVLTSHNLPVSSTACSVTGILGYYSSHYQLLPIDANCISTGASAALPSLTGEVGGEDNEHPTEVPSGEKITLTAVEGFATTYQIGDGAQQSVSTSGTEITLSGSNNDVIVITIASTREYYNGNGKVYFYKINNALTKYDIVTTTPSNGTFVVKNSGGTAINSSMAAQTITLAATPAANYHFVSWAIKNTETTADVTSAVELSSSTDKDATFVMPAYGVTVSATFAENPYATVSFVKGAITAEGTAPDDLKVYVGQNATMPANPFTNSGWSFAGWEYNSTTYHPGDTYEVTAAGAIEFAAKWREKDINKDGQWELVTKVSELNAGDYVVIAQKAQGVTESAQISTNTNKYLYGVETTFSGDDNEYITKNNLNNTTAVKYVLGGTSGAWTLTDDATGKLLKIGSSDNPSWVDNNGSTWNIVINNESNALIYPDGSETKRVLFNTSTGFRPYTTGPNDNMLLPQLYKFYRTAFILSYDANEGEGAPDSQRADPDNGQVTISSTVPTREGYDFAGWEDGDGNAKSGTITLTENTTLYAQWSATPYNAAVASVENIAITATPAGESAIAEGSNADVAYGAEVTLAYSELDNAYLFVEWTVTKADDAETVVPVTNNKFSMPAYAVAISADVQAKASVILNVTYEANGGEGTIEGNPFEFTYEQEVTVAANPFEKAQYTFMGWQDQDETVYKPGDKFNIVKNMTLTAIWRANGAMYTITSNTAVSSSASVPAGSGATYSQSYSGNNGQMTGENSTTLTLTGYANKIIKKAIFSMRTNKNDGAGSIQMTIGDRTVINYPSNDFGTWFGPCQNTYKDIEVAISDGLVNANENIVVSMSASESSIYVASYTFEYANAEVYDETTSIPAGEKEVIVVKDGGNVTLTGNVTAEDVIVEAGGKLTNNAALAVNDLTINSEFAKSGQVTGSNINVSGDIYLEIKLLGDGTGTMSQTESQQWYCISAPFDVSMNDGFFWGNGIQMGHNVDFQAFVYDGAKRANNGTSGWQRVSGKLEAGKAYLIGFDDERTNYKTIRLKAMTKDIPTVDKLPTTGHTAAETKNSNWNGVGNPTLHYIALDGFTAKVQCYDNDLHAYKAYDPTTHNYVVGTTLFMQAEDNIDLKAAGNANYRAPKRVSEENENYSFCVEIAKENATRCDNRLYVSTSDEATSSYEQGKDMLSMNGTSSKFGALIWTENYGMRLASEDVLMVNNQATYTMGIYAPANGTYTISTVEASADADLYLTYEGSIIWNLSMGEYETDLEKGTTNGYGLLLQAKAPQVVTGVDEVDAETGVQKIIIDEHVFILRGGKMYDVTGKMVK